MALGILVGTEAGEPPRQFALTGATVQVGRGSDCAIVLAHKSVSRLHATIERRPSGFLLIDQHSRNGTRVNGIAIVRRTLRDGDRVSFGDAAMDFHVVDEEAIPAAVNDFPPSTPPSEEDESPPSATFAVPSKDFGEKHDLRLDSAWRAMQMFGAAGTMTAEDIVRAIVTELGGIRDVEKVLVHLLPSALSPAARWIRPSSGARMGTAVPEEKILEAARTGKSFTVSNRKYSDVFSAERPDAACIAILVGRRPAGCLYLEGDDTLGRGVVQAARATADAIGIGLTIWTAAGQQASPASAPELDEPSPVIIGQSRPLRQAVQMAEKAAASDSNVLLLGETGTGKELFARLIYQESGRAAFPFVPVHCSAIEETLMGSTLFGHEKGAFTGAVGMKRGVFEVADRGTIFLDEIGELSLPMQVKFLRVLQEGEFMRVGGTQPIRVNVRAIAATNRNLKEAVKEGRFREDLYYRLSVLEVVLPPLRKRTEDIPDLVNHFRAEIGSKVAATVRRVSPEAMDLMCRYEWPGNIRELRNVVERCLVLAEGDTLTVDDLPTEITEPGGAAGESGLSRGDLGGEQGLDAAQDRHIRHVLLECRGNKRLAARRLGISRSTLYEKLKLMTPPRAP